jgi:hypothetical protein
MSINVPSHYVQQYTTNLALLLQQQGSKLRPCVTIGAYTGEQAAVVDQIAAIEMQQVTTRFGDMPRVDAAVDRRWVTPADFDLPQLLDSFDKLRLITDPESSYVQNAMLAAGRKTDSIILSAFTGSAKTGKTGSTTTAFTSGNEVDVATGGANSKLNVEKLLSVRELMMANHIDFDREEVFVGLTAVDHIALLREIQVISSDYNPGSAVMKDGKLDSYLGFNFVHCELIESVLAGTNEVTLPVWCKSGMHLGIWGDVSASVSQRHDIQGEPWQVYTKLTMGATRTEEDRVYAIESYRA